VRTLDGKTGSVTVRSTVSPPSGDLSEPVVAHTKRYVRSFWALDSRRAQARIYPAINPLLSYAEDTDVLANWWRVAGNGRWRELRRKTLSLLQEQVKLERMARIIGRNALADGQQITLLYADLFTSAFLSQSAFSPVDRYCSPARQGWMLQLLDRFEELAQSAIREGVPTSDIAELEILRRLQRMGEEVEDDNWSRFEELAGDLEHAFRRLISERRKALPDREVEGDF